jgi:hypothetical protein
MQYRYINSSETERVNVAVTVLTCIGEVLGSNLGWGRLFVIFLGPVASFRDNASSHGRVLPNPFQFIIHLSSYHSTLYNIDTDDAAK